MESLSAVCSRRKANEWMRSDELNRKDCGWLACLKDELTGIMIYNRYMFNGESI